MISRQIILRGRWLYDGTVYMPATVVALDYDLVEIGKVDDRLEAGEESALNHDGLLYYVCFRSNPEQPPGWVDSPGFPDLQPREPALRLKCRLERVVAA